MSSSDEIVHQEEEEKEPKKQKCEDKTSEDKSKVVKDMLEPFIIDFLELTRGLEWAEKKEYLDFVISEVRNNLSEKIDSRNE